MQENQCGLCYLNSIIPKHEALCCVLMFTAGLLLTGFSPLAHAQLYPTNIVVVDLNAGTDNRGVLLRVDPLTGTRTVLSDFGNSSQGELGSGPLNLAVESSEAVLVLDPEVNKLFRVNPITGQRTVLSDFSDPAQGPVPDNAAQNGVLGIAVERSGEILVTAQGAGSPNPGGTVFRDAILRINPANGHRTVLSDFGNPAQGPLGGQCSFGIAIEASGTILVTDCNNLGGSSGGLLFRIDPVTGQRTVLSDFGNPAQGGLARFPSGMAVEASGTILVAAPFAGSAPAGAMSPGGALFRVDPESGQRTVLSDFGNATQGTTGTLLRAAAVEATGTPLVVDQDVDDFGAGLGMLFRVDPLTGQRTVLSDFGDPTLGSGQAPWGVAVISVAGENPFTALDAQLTLVRKPHRKGHFIAKGSFTLADTNDGIDPKIEAVVLSLSDTDGGFFSQTLPPGSLKHSGKGEWIFRAHDQSTGIRLMTIKPTHTVGTFTFIVIGKKVDLTGADHPPMKVSLQIGNDAGSTEVPCRGVSKRLDRR